MLSRAERGARVGSSGLFVTGYRTGRTTDLTAKRGVGEATLAQQTAAGSRRTPYGRQSPNASETDGSLVLRIRNDAGLSILRSREDPERCGDLLAGDDADFTPGVFRGDVIVHESLECGGEFFVGALEGGEFLTVNVDRATRGFAGTGKADADVGGL
jgi:hypothetical protein